MSRLLALAIAACVVSAAVACETPRQGEIDPAGPDEATFAPVADMLITRCGSIDCHGSTYRNLRLYGYTGLRLSPNDRPDMPETTTAAEISADYDAVVSLEPAILREVVAAKGAGADRLTLVRKARGTEHHKGDAPIAIGDDADLCLLGWLGGAVDVAACQRAVEQR